MAVLGKLLKRSGGGCGGGEGPKDCGPSENLSAAKKMLLVGKCIQLHRTALAMLSPWLFIT